MQLKMFIGLVITYGRVAGLIIKDNLEDMTNVLPLCIVNCHFIAISMNFDYHFAFEAAGK